VWNKASDALCRPEDLRGGAAFALATRLPRELHLPRRLLSPSSGKSSSVPEPTPLPAGLGQAAQSDSGRLSSVRIPASRLDEVARVPLSVPARFHCTLVADWTTCAGVFRRGPPLRYSTRPPNASRRPSGRAEKMHLSDVCNDRSTLRAPDRNRPTFPACARKRVALDGAPPASEHPPHDQSSSKLHASASAVRVAWPRTDPRRTYRRLLAKPRAARLRTRRCRRVPRASEDPSGAPCRTRAREEQAPPEPEPRTAVPVLPSRRAALSAQSAFRMPALSRLPASAIENSSRARPGIA
jgi:hypothetical protein